MVHQSAWDDADSDDEEPSSDVLDKSFEAVMEPADEPLVGKVSTLQTTACRHSRQVLHPQPC